MTRRIIHIDMDAFFASIEQRDHPEYRGKPLAVGFDGPRGVVSTASYEARTFGVHSAMSMAKAKQQCPQLLIVPCNHAHYKEVSSAIHDIFLKHTYKIEPLSIDEAFLDVSEQASSHQMAIDIALEIKKEIVNKLSLTASAGVSYNKLLAKIASDYNKPNGIYSVDEEQAQSFLDQLTIDKFWSIGPKTANIMHRMGIYTGGQLRKVSLKHLEEIFGKAGLLYYQFTRGIDNREVRVEKVRKSVGCERTFLTDIHQKSVVYIELYHIVEELVERLSASAFEGVTLTIKVKYDDFKQITRSITAHHSLKSKSEILSLARQLMQAVDFNEKRIRLLGLSVSNPVLEEEPKKLWIEGFLDFK